ncbi:COMPASS component SDC1 [Candida viswanathii]|uniref:COMPASS component SDC1 n=1 Tax=Candida viswanathii TaxID=5486 RepID=A0A367YJP1_9ASCO|nr:COMPASS component SDC1 [Candida viswanathii]
MEVDEQPGTSRNDSSSPITGTTNNITNGTPIETDNRDSIARHPSSSSATTPPPPQSQTTTLARGSTSVTPAPTPSKKTKQEPTSLDNQPPMHEIVGGSSVRRYLNEHVTLTLLEGLKELAQVKPEDPLKYLGEYLIAKSEESRS